MTDQQLDEWVQRNLAYLTATSTPPWKDSSSEDNKTSNEEDELMGPYHTYAALEGLARIVTVAQCCAEPAPTLGELWTDEDGRRHRPLDCATCGTRLLRLNWEAVR